MEQKMKDKITYILDEINANGLTWKKGKDISHLKTRKSKGHLPSDFNMQDYENVIMDIIIGKEHEVYLYYKEIFGQEYFVFGNGQWIVIIGADAIMETSFPIDSDYQTYLSEEKGYNYLGKIKEVFE